MAFEERIEALRARHQALEAELARESCRPCPDDRTLVMIKKRKLLLKDEITRLGQA